MPFLKICPMVLGRISSHYISPYPVFAVSTYHIGNSGKELQRCSHLLIKTRLFSEDRRHNTQQKISAVFLPNPIALLKNKWLTFRIQKEIDPDFNLDDFASGASYAVSHLTYLMSTKQYSVMRDVVYDKKEAPVDIFRNYTESLSDPALVSEMYFTPEEITIVHPRIVGISKEDKHLVTIDVAAIGYKLHDEARSLILQLQLRFGQSYLGGVTSGWLVYHVLFIRLQEIIQPKLR